MRELAYFKFSSLQALDVLDLTRTSALELPSTHKVRARKGNSNGISRGTGNCWPTRKLSIRENLLITPHHQNLSSQTTSKKMSSPTIRLLPHHLRPLTHQYKHSIPTSLSAKCYHSYDRPSSSDSPFPPVETSILRASVPHIPTHGFTLTALSLGAQDVGYIPAATNLFPTGAFSLVHYHLYTRRSALKNHTELIAPPPENEGTEPPKGVGKRVKGLTWERLMGNQDIIHKWQEVCNSCFT